MRIEQDGGTNLLRVIARTVTLDRYAHSDRCAKRGIAGTCVSEIVENVSFFEKPTTDQINTRFANDFQSVVPFQSAKKSSFVQGSRQRVLNRELQPRS